MRLEQIIFVTLFFLAMFILRIVGEYAPNLREVEIAGAGLLVGIAATVSFLWQWRPRRLRRGVRGMSQREARIKAERLRQQIEVKTQMPEQKELLPPIF
jgi:hypothetical protein